MVIQLLFVGIDFVYIWSLYGFRVGCATWFCLLWSPHMPHVSDIMVVALFALGLSRPFLATYPRCTALSRESSQSPSSFFFKKKIVMFGLLFFWRKIFTFFTNIFLNYFYYLINIKLLQYIFIKISKNTIQTDMFM